jgi:hypothetical protein
MIHGVRVRARPCFGLTLIAKCNSSTAASGARSNRTVAGTTPNQSSGPLGPYLIGIHGSRRSSLTGNFGHTELWRLK